MSEIIKPNNAPYHKNRVDLPDFEYIRIIMRKRKARFHYFDKKLFADPAWDILLDLSAARSKCKQVSITSLCIAAEAPTTTALRWINQMVDEGLLLRVPDPQDGRRQFVVLTEQATDAMARYFHEVSKY